MMVGLPGAGKSTWAKENHPDLDIICKDGIRTELGFLEEGEKGLCKRLTQEKIVDKVFFERITQCIRDRKDIVIDDPNNRKILRRKLKDMFKDLDIKWVYVWIEAPDLETNNERRAGQLPKGFIEMVQKSSQPPTEDEYDEIIHIKQTKTNEKD